MTRIWTGTAEVVSGYTTVVLTGDPLTAANCPADATIVLGGLTYFVAEADYPTMTVELTRAYEGTDGAVSAEIDPMTPVTGSVVALAQDLTNYNARLALLEADGKGLFYTILGQTGANDPGPGKVARNAAAWADVTALYIDVLDAGGFSAAPLVDEWVTDTIITVRSIDTRAYAAYRLLADPVDESGWRSVAVEFIGGDGSLADGEDVAIAWNPLSALTLDYDAHVAAVADLAQFAHMEDGFSVLVSDVGDGRSGIYALDTSGSPADWVGPAIITGEQGEQGPQGDPGEQGETGPANTLTIGTVEGGPAADAEITGTAPNQTLNLVLPQGDAGENGWSPVFAIATDGARRVLQLAGYVGGTGTEPTDHVGEYVGASGYTSTIGDAVDIRGPAGAAGAGSGDMQTSVYDPQGIEDDAFDRANHTGTQSADTITDGTTNKAFTATEKTKLSYISVTQAVDLDALESAVVPAGGTTGQVLKKASNADNDTEWADDAGGGGTGGVVACATRTDLKALDTGVVTEALLIEAGREGLFLWKSGDYSSHITADTEEGVYVKADAVASSSGAWVREISSEALNVDWFGAAPNTTTDSQPAIQAAYDLIVATAGITEGMMGRIVAPSGKYRLGSSLEFSKPVGFYCPGYLEYTPTSGSALIIGAAIPTGGQNTGYDIKIGGIRAINGNAAAPTGYNSSGCSGVEVRNMQFSTLWVGRIIAFTKAGFWGNQTNDVYALQHCQDNTIHLGDVAYCGEGVRIESVDAALGAFQVNRVQVQNSFGNWTNFRIGGSGDNNSNNNIFVFHAMDADTGGGAGFIRGMYNDLQFGYADGVIAFESGSAYNRCFAQVGAAQVVFTDAGTSNEIKRATEGWTTPNTSSPPIRVESTDAGASVAELIKLKRSSASPAANDGGAAIGFYFNDDGGTERLGARIRTDMPSVEAGGNRNTRLIFDTIVGGSADVRAILWQGLSVGNVADQGSGTVNALTAYYQNSVKVVGARRTGWAAATGTATRTTFATGSVTLPQLAERVKALIDDLIAHGLIGS